MKKTISLVLCTVMALSLLPVSAFSQSGMSNYKKSLTYTQGKYTDVATSDWFSPNVAAAYEYGLVKGVASNSFGAASNVKISEIVALAARLNSIYNIGKYSFAEGTPWYQVYVDYAVANGIISNTRFENYDVYATRYQVAEILAAALPSSALTAINNINYGDIPDVSLEASYTNVYVLYNAGVLTGKTAAGNFFPAENVLRSEVAAIVTRMGDPGLRAKFTIDKSSPDGSGTITTGAQLLDAVNNGRQTVTLAIQSYTAAAYYYAMANATLGAAALNSANQYTQMAATYAHNSAAFCKANSKYSAAYDNTNNSYLGCIEASKNIAKVAAAPMAVTTDWASVSTLLNGCGEALSRATETISTIG